MKTPDLLINHTMELRLLVALASAFITYAAIKLFDLTASLFSALGAFVKSQRNRSTVAAH